MTDTSAPLFATGLKPHESLRLQSALSRLIGREVSDEERVAETLIAALDTIADRLAALEVTHET